MTVSGSMASDDIFCVRRWRRTEHDRLYVDTVDGTQLGYYDLNSGLVHAADVAYESQIVFVAQRYCRARPDSVVAPDDCPDVPLIGEPDDSPIFSQVVRALGMPPIDQPLVLIDPPQAAPEPPRAEPQIEIRTADDSTGRHLFVVAAA